MDRKSRRWIIAAVIGAGLLVAIVVVVLTTSSSVSKNKQKAIELVKEYLDEPGSAYNPGMFETWEATGDNNTMVVSATYYPQGEVLHTMKWQVHLNSGKVIYLETVDPDG